MTQYNRLKKIFHDENIKIIGSGIVKANDDERIEKWICEHSNRDNWFYVYVNVLENNSIYSIEVMFEENSYKYEFKFIDDEFFESDMECLIDFIVGE